MSIHSSWRLAVHRACVVYTVSLSQQLIFCASICSIALSIVCDSASAYVLHIILMLNLSLNVNCAFCNIMRKEVPVVYSRYCYRTSISATYPSTSLLPLPPLPSHSSHLSSTHLILSFPITTPNLSHPRRLSSRSTIHRPAPSTSTKVRLTAASILNYFGAQERMQK